ncbi:hypothetical protein J2S01_001772 [Pectinatus haikarae]|uniref:Uncharacterized protein n=1 Tax=Pectinatus haikarae TaxID=349096 RepID=A0ABT9Y891_9FIRM|nr:hypothetical protein [Pectinatus haikarae]
MDTAQVADVSMEAVEENIHSVYESAETRFR